MGEKAFVVIGKGGIGTSFLDWLKIHDEVYFKKLHEDSKDSKASKDITATNSTSPKDFKDALASPKEAGDLFMRFIEDKIKEKLERIKKIARALSKSRQDL